VAKTKVIWTENARQILNDIGLYIAQEGSVERAVDFTQRLYDSTVRLQEFPLSGGPVPEDLSCKQVVVDGYRIVYQVTEHGAEVLTIISPGRDAVRMLSKEKP
jgi:plasmid stabilization system protein ParE